MLHHDPHDPDADPARDRARRDRPSPPAASLTSATFLLVTCEHAGNDVPVAWRHVFASGPDGMPDEATEALLAGHRGWDPGALGVATRLAARLGVPLLAHPVTRLLVDVNRSRTSPELFSDFTRGLPEADRAAIVERHHAPFRAGVERVVAAAVRAGHRVLHVSVHTFVERLDGRRRDLDVGLLFDPARAWEQRDAETWAEALTAVPAGATPWRVRFNEPYRGVDDGLATSMRSRFSGASYAGLELEVRQGLVSTRAEQRAAADRLAVGLAGMLAVSATATFDRGGPVAGPESAPPPAEDQPPQAPG